MIIRKKWREREKEGGEGEGEREKEGGEGEGERENALNGYN